ncbi:pt repeat family protein [Diplodia corticola]|uniref:Pt repeat family protein n=1 Tax=Diplodia corticola TaxID=236234 RepID=A0A1J9R6A5_9PEZI|nr:pt repeat family protein [Diplodia corticola]OJD36081.1 pt repeat family protein [Diplodia corticola]
MPLRKHTPKRRAPYLDLKPMVSEADLNATNRPPQTIKHPASKGSFRLHRPSRYLPSWSSSLEAMDLSRPKMPVTITFSVPGTRPPVFVASSLTSPPWAPIEMDIKDERTTAGDLVFEKTFDAIEPGEYQYKFRLGPGDWWVCDESAPIVCDDSGNRNNLLRITEPRSPALDRSEPSPTRSTSSAPEVATENATSRDQAEDGEAGKSRPDPAPAPLPFTVVDKAPDAEQPVYGGKRSSSLGEDASKRTADAEPDGEFEPLETNSSLAKSETQDALSVPAVVVEKVDDAPAHGDDLGAGATRGQHDAHAKRAADAEPDEVVVTGDVDEPKELSRLRLVPESEGPGETQAVEDQPSPLLPHEELEPLSDEAPLLPHERSTSVSNAGSEDDQDAVASADFAPVEFDGDVPLFRHESISVADSPPRSPSQTRPKSHTSLQDMMDEEDINDPSIEPFPTRRETIYEHLQTLAAHHRMEVDITLPEDAETSPHRKTSRSSSSELLPPASPLDSIKEAEEIEEEDADKLPSPMAPESVVERPIPAVPTPPLTPKDDDNTKRHDRADSLVTVTGEESSRDGKSQANDTNGTEELAAQTNAEPAVASAEVERPSTSHSAKVTPNQKHSSFLIKFWNNLFGSWLGPVVRWFSRVCGGQGRATVLVLAIGTAIIAYSFQSTLLGTEVSSVADQ